MPSKMTFDEAVALIRQRDPRFDAGAYIFIREVLDFTVEHLDKPLHGPERNVTGQELLECIRLYALQEFGPLARRVFSEWGIERTEDFGDIVFNLVEQGVLGKTPRDSKNDFRNGYDFTQAFTAPFLPSGHLAGRASSAASGGEEP